MLDENRVKAWMREHSAEYEKAYAEGMSRHFDGFEKEPTFDKDEYNRAIPIAKCEVFKSGALHCDYVREADRLGALVPSCGWPWRTPICMKITLEDGREANVLGYAMEFMSLGCFVSDKGVIRNHRLYATIMQIVLNGEMRPEGELALLGDEEAERVYEAYNLPGVDFTRDFIAVYNFWGKFCRDMGITNEGNFVKWVVAWYRGERVEIPGLPPDQYKTKDEANAEIEAELQKEIEEEEREESEAKEQLDALFGE